MAAHRTNEVAVRQVIELAPGLDINPFITAANVLTTRVASQDSSGILGADALSEIERYLAAHFANSRDPQPQEETVDRDVSATYQGKTEVGLDGTWWGQHAQLLDFTGELSRMSKGTVAKVVWLGKPVSEQTPYQNRD